jgi:hypothetical protein
MAYTKLYDTAFHGVMVEVHNNEHGWYMARVPRGPLANLSAFASSPARARTALEAMITTCALYGTQGIPGRLDPLGGRKVHKRRKRPRSAMRGGTASIAATTSRQRPYR